MICDLPNIIPIITITLDMARCLRVSRSLAGVVSGGCILHVTGEVWLCDTLHQRVWLKSGVTSPQLLWRALLTPISLLTVSGRESRDTITLAGCGSNHKPGKLPCNIYIYLISVGSLQTGLIKGVTLSPPSSSSLPAGSHCGLWCQSCKVCSAGAAYQDFYLY